MKKWKASSKTLLLCLTLLTATSVFSAEMRTIPEEKMQGAVSYVTGGIGHDEAVAMKHASSKYALSLEFARHSKPRGEYLADVEVTIKDRKGHTVLEAVSDGPFLLTNIAPGSYTVWATSEGKTQKQQVSLGKNKNRHLLFAW